MPDIVHSVTIHGRPESVYRAVATAEGIRGWWTRDAALEPRLGGPGQFGFNDGKVMTTVEVTELVPPARVAWRTLSSNAPGGWAGTTITFSIQAECGGTSLQFSHEGFKDEGDGYLRVRSGWAYYLASLKQYIETGTGTPR